MAFTRHHRIEICSITHKYLETYCRLHLQFFGVFLPFSTQTHLGWDTRSDKPN